MGASKIWIILAGLLVIVVLSWNAYWKPISALYPKQKIYVHGDKTISSILNETMIHRNIKLGETRVEDSILTSSQVIQRRSLHMIQILWTT